MKVLVTVITIKKNKKVSQLNFSDTEKFLPLIKEESTVFPEFLSIIRA